METLTEKEMFGIEGGDGWDTLSSMFEALMVLAGCS